MKLLLCLCLIFCFKTVFSDVTCYICQTTNNKNNPQFDNCMKHNRYNLHMCCSTIRFHCERLISHTAPIPNHLFSQYFPSFVSEFQNTNVVNPLDVMQQHRFPVPLSPNYNNIVRPNPTGRFEPRPYERPEVESGAYSEFLKRMYGQQSSSNNRNVPSNGFNFHQNTPQHTYPTRPNFPQHDTESTFPRPPNYGGVGQPNFSRGPAGFYDNDNDNSNYGGIVKKEHHTREYEVVNGIPHVKQYSFVMNGTDIGPKSYSHTKNHTYESVNGAPVIDKTTVHIKKGGSPDADDVDAEEESKAVFIPASGNHQQQN